MRLKWLRAFSWLAACLALLVMLFALGWVRTSAAQQSPAAKPSDQDATKKEGTEEPPATIIRGGTTLITTPVTVFDSGRQFVYDIDPNEFKVYDNGIPQKIDQVGTELHPVDIVIVVETNNLTDPFLPDIRNLGPMFSDMLMGPQGSVALITYSDRVERVLDFTTNGDKLDEAMRKLVGRGGGMHLNDAMIYAYEMLETRPKEDRKVVMLFSDEHNLGGKTSRSELVKRVMNSNVTVYVEGFTPAKGLWKRPEQDPRPDIATEMGARPLPPGVPVTPTNEENIAAEDPVPIMPILLDIGEELKSILFKNSAEFFAIYSGGTYYQKWGKSDLQNTINTIATEIRGQYELSYYPNVDQLQETGYHKIKVEVRRPGAKVRARQGYFYQATPK
jgi:VWFA-related protein